MSVGRVVSGVVASVAVAGCAVVVVGIGRADHRSTAQHRSIEPSEVAATSRPATTARPTTAAPAPVTAAPLTSASATAGATASTAVPVPVTVTTPAGVPVTHTIPVRRATVAATPAVATRSSTHAAVRKAPTPAVRKAPVARAAVRGTALPLHWSTGSATRVVTVTASSSRSTTATLQPWVKQPGGGWKKQGSAIHAHIGADGMSSHPSESRSATPIGSFTLTQAFGYYRNPGSPLPYFRTTMSDYWISSPGRLYNTHQRCGSCGYNNGVNERLATETPFYNYAVVIDYNTRNAPGGVRQGAGSAFFLHVTDGSATAGCVAIPQSRLVPIMKWLNPKTHPRILIGVT